MDISSILYKFENWSKIIKINGIPISNHYQLYQLEKRFRTMDSILKKVHLASVNDTFKVVRFFRNGVLKCRYFDSIQMAGTQIDNIEARRGRCQGRLKQNIWFILYRKLASCEVVGCVLIALHIVIAHYH